MVLITHNIIPSEATPSLTLDIMLDITHGNALEIILQTLQQFLVKSQPFGETPNAKFNSSAFPVESVLFLHTAFLLPPGTGTKGRGNEVWEVFINFQSK